MDELKIYIHIGMAKTGTTFFQNAIANNINNVKYFGLAEDMNIGDIIWGRESKYLISNEGIAASIVDKNSVKEFERRITRMKDFFSNVRVIFSVRKHENLIISSYLQYQYTKNPTIEIDEFFNVENTDDGIVNYRDVLLSERVKILKELFGDKLFIYKTEELENNLEEMLTSLSDFIGESINVDKIIDSERSNISMNKVDHLLRKKIGGGIKYISDKLYRKIPKTSEIVRGKWKFDVENEMKRKIEDMYREDWRRVNKLLDQNRRGYSIEVEGNE